MAIILAVFIVMIYLVLIFAVYKIAELVITRAPAFVPQIAKDVLIWIVLACCGLLAIALLLNLVGAVSLGFPGVHPILNR